MQALVTPREPAALSGSHCWHQVSYWCQVYQEGPGYKHMVEVGRGVYPCWGHTHISGFFEGVQWQE